MTKHNSTARIFAFRLVFKWLTEVYTRRLNSERKFIRVSGLKHGLTKLLYVLFMFKMYPPFEPFMIKSRIMSRRDRFLTLSLAFSLFDILSPHYSLRPPGISHSRGLLVTTTGSQSLPQAQMHWGNGAEFQVRPFQPWSFKCRWTKKIKKWRFVP